MTTWRTAVISAAVVLLVGCSSTKQIGSPGATDSSTTTAAPATTPVATTAPASTVPASTASTTPASSTLPPLEALQVGSNGPRVRDLQQALNDVGNTLVLDGIFGPATRDAVKAYQQMIGQPVDGIAGPDTLAAIGLGQHRVGSYPSLDAISADMANYLNTGATGGLPADIVTAIAWFVYTAPAASPFIVVNIDRPASGLGIVTLTGLDQQGTGPVVVLQLCFQAAAPFTWCGVLSVGADDGGGDY